MLYPVCVHRARDGTLGVIIPDFPGVFSAASSWEDLPRMVQEAIEVGCQGEDIEIPAPTPIDDLRGKAAYRGGVWAFIDVDLNALDTRRRRINISVPAYALREIDAHVRARGGTRSGILVDSALQAIRAGGPSEPRSGRKRPAARRAASARPAGGGRKGPGAASPGRAKQGGRRGSARARGA